MKRSPLTRRSRIKPKKRSASEKSRIYGTDERIAWLKGRACLVSHRPDLHACMGAIECAHTENGGMGRKANAETTVPLCHAAHRLLHTIGQRSFERTYGLDLTAEAARVGSAWLRHCEEAA
jgi:hypothetical protein